MEKMVVNSYRRLINLISYYKAYFAWAMATLFYLYQYVIRVSPGMMIDEIRSEFEINAEQFATLGSGTLVVYAILQIPMGILMDKIGANRVILGSIALCSISSAMASYTDVFWVMQLSRIITGVGAAAGFMSGIKIVVDNFEHGNRALLMGATLSIGTGGVWLYGMLFGDVSYGNWRQVFQYLAISGVVIFILSYLLLTPSEKNHSISNLQNKADDINVYGIISEIVGIFKNPDIMIYAVLAIVFYSPLVTLTDLWGKAFLQVRFGIEDGASQLALLPYFGLSIGAILLPLFCEKRQILDWGIIVSCFALGVVFAFILYVTPMAYYILWLSLFIMGFLCGADMICFTAAVRSATNKNSGLIIGVVNTLNMIGGAILQQIVGTLLDIRWQGTFDQNGMRLYSEHDFVTTLSSITVVLVLCCALSLFLKRKN